MNYSVKEPNECSDVELDKFYELVKEGGKVEIKGLKARINKCVILGFCISDNEIIGVSSIKRPSRNYREGIISKAQIDRKYNELDFELGYSFTDKNYRKKGISTNIKTRLLDWMKDYGGTIFSTTAISSSQNFLLQNEFKHYGITYDGKNDKNLKYYEITF